MVHSQQEIPHVYCLQPGIGRHGCLEWRQFGLGVEEQLARSVKWLLVLKVLDVCQIEQILPHPRFAELLTQHFGDLGSAVSEASLSQQADQAHVCSVVVCQQGWKLTAVAQVKLIEHLITPADDFAWNGAATALVGLPSQVINTVNVKDLQKTRAQNLEDAVLTSKLSRHSVPTLCIIGLS